MSGSLLNLYATIASQYANFTEDMTADEVITEAMRGSRQNWMTTDENELHTAALAVAYTKLNDADKERLKLTMEANRALNALLAGVPVNLEAVAEKTNGAELFKLAYLWKRSEGAA